MADIAVGNVTVSVPAKRRNILPAGKAFRLALVEITFGNGVLTYPTGGVPLPDKSHFGMKREIIDMQISGPAGVKYAYKYEPSTHKIRMWHATSAGGAVEETNVVAPAAATLIAHVTGS